jgi:hypothetical protein
MHLLFLFLTIQELYHLLQKEIYLTLLCLHLLLTPDDD